MALLEESSTEDRPLTLDFLQQRVETINARGGRTWRAKASARGGVEYQV